MSWARTSDNDSQALLLDAPSIGPLDLRSAGH